MWYANYISIKFEKEKNIWVYVHDIFIISFTSECFRWIYDKGEIFKIQPDDLHLLIRSWAHLHIPELSKYLVYSFTIHLSISSCPHPFLVSFFHSLPHFRVIISCITFFNLSLYGNYTFNFSYLMAIYKIITCIIIKFKLKKKNPWTFINLENEHLWLTLNPPLLWLHPPFHPCLPEPRSEAAAPQPSWLLSLLTSFLLPRIAHVVPSPAPILLAKPFPPTPKLLYSSEVPWPSSCSWPCIYCWSICSPCCRICYFATVVLDPDWCIFK